VRRSAISPAKAERLLGWTPRISLEQGLTATYEWFVQHTRTATNP
jgi:nucleoside-diphosphate-sugar epimerase